MAGDLPGEWPVDLSANGQLFAGRMSGDFPGM
jgi:hypothetical protein